MAEKIFNNVRLALKIDTLENWNKSSLVLKNGELAFATVAASAGNGLTDPVCMVKIGNGEKTFSELTWDFYAKASDVLAACKSEESLTTFVNGVIASAGIASDDAMKELADRVTDVEDAIETLNGDDATEGSVAKAIKDAVDALDLANTYAAKEHGHEIADVEGLSDALAGLQTKGDYAAEVHAHEMSEVNGLVEALAGKEAAGEAKKVQDALDEYKTDNDAAVKANTDAIAAIKDHESVDSFADVMAEIAKKQDIIPENTYDAYGAAAQALTDAKAYTDAQVKVEKERAEGVEADLQAAIDAINNETTGILKQAKDYADGKDEAIAAAKQAGDDAQADVDALAELVGTLPEGTTAATVVAYVDEKTKGIATDESLSALTDRVTQAEEDIDAIEADYLKAADKQELTDAINAKVASVTAADASVTVGGTSTAPTVAAKLSADADNALKLAEDGLKVVIPAAAEYSIVKAADSGDYAAVYNLTKDGAIVGASINIPKDMVVKSGSVVGDEIVLVLNDEAATEIKIPVASLIEYVTSGSATGDMVVVNVSDDHKVTATITDGTITLAKLTTEVQTAIGKAHSHENATVLDGINADKVAAWDAAEANAIAEANKLNTAMNTRVEALEAIDHDHTNKAELDKIADGDVAKWNAAEAKAHEHTNKAELDKFVDGDKAKLDSAVQTVTAAADSGLKATRTGNDIAIEIDDSITFVFDCGDAEVTA